MDTQEIYVHYDFKTANIDQEVAYVGVGVCYADEPENHICLGSEILRYKVEDIGHAQALAVLEGLNSIIVHYESSKELPKQFVINSMVFRCIEHLNKFIHELSEWKKDRKAVDSTIKCLKKEQVFPKTEEDTITKCASTILYIGLHIFGLSLSDAFSRVEIKNMRWLENEWACKAGEVAAEENSSLNENSYTKQVGLKVNSFILAHEIFK